MATYLCMQDGIEKHDRRNSPRGDPDGAFERLFNGLHNLRNNAKERGDEYDVGYITAMMIALAELERRDVAA